MLPGTRSGFSRDQIGSIRISPNETHVELRPDAAAQLMDRAGAEQIIDKSLYVHRVSGPEDMTARQDDNGPSNRRGNRRDDGPRERPARRERTERGDHSGRSDRGARRERPGQNNFDEKPARKGPKKPRGPNGEKKRSPKKQYRD